MKKPSSKLTLNKQSLLALTLGGKPKTKTNETPECSCSVKCCGIH